MPETIYPLKEPLQPQFLPVALMALDHLARDKVVLEYGSGHSTAWLYERACGLASVEHDPGWHNEVRSYLETHYHRAWGVVGLFEQETDYVGHARIFPDWYFDLVVVDGYGPWRIPCIDACLSKVKPGGWLVVDDTHWQDLSDHLRQHLAFWDMSMVSGNFVRLSGIERYHQTTFYRRPECG